MIQFLAMRHLTVTAGFGRLAVVAGLGLLSFPVQPFPLTGQEAPAEWWGRLDGYVWFSNVDATSVVGGVVIPVGDSTLRAGPVFRAEAGRGRWGTLAEFRRARIDGFTAEVTPAGAGATFDLKITDLEGAATFRVTGDAAAHRVYALAGLRYVKHSMMIDRTEPGTVHQDWIEPFGGFRFDSPLGGPFRFSAVGNIGGLGIGSSFTWVVEGELGLRLFDGVEFLTRYRYSEAEYQSRARLYGWDDGQVQGWLFGLGVSR